MVLDSAVSSLPKGSDTRIWPFMPYLPGKRGVREKEDLLIECPLFAKLDCAEVSLSSTNSFNLHDNPGNRHYPTHFTDEES